MIDAVSESLYEHGVDVISALQSWFPDSESFFMGISQVGDPKYVFTIYFPIIFAIHWALGVQLLGTIIVVEWLNQVLKWLMHGERPYWWILEAESHNVSSLPDIIQYPSTCETGPGTPSGHSMAMSAVWYIIIRSAVDQLVKPSNKLSASQKHVATQLLWGVYIIIQALIITSRMYIAAHFPHQCILGLLLGISLARAVYSSSKWMNFRRFQWIIVSCVILGSAVGTYFLLVASGTDPSWSIQQAIKWCAKQEYIHVDTTPFYSLVRYSGAVFGLGLGITSKYFRQTDRTDFGIRRTVATSFMGLVVGNLAELGHRAIPKSNPLTFYSLEFALNLTLPYAVVAVVPYLVTRLITKKEKSS